MRRYLTKYRRKDILWILPSCKTLENNQLDLSHSCLLYRESNSWRERFPSNCFLTQRQNATPDFEYSQNIYILQVICYVPASIAFVIPRHLSGIFLKPLRKLELSQHFAFCPQNKMLAGIVLKYQLPAFSILKLFSQTSSSNACAYFRQIVYEC